MKSKWPGRRETRDAVKREGWHFLWSLSANRLYMERNQESRQTAQIQAQLHQLEDQYAEALGNDADIYTLSAIWRKIKELKRELGEEEGRVR